MEIVFWVLSTPFLLIGALVGLDRLEDGVRRVQGTEAAGTSNRTAP